MEDHQKYPHIRRQVHMQDTTLLCVWLLQGLLAVCPQNGECVQVLGLDKQASQEAIKAAFRKKALRLHPDKNPSPEAAEEFKVIAAAYGILSDPEKKRKCEWLSAV